MATYGLSRYGVAKYGYTALVQYDAEPFLAQSLRVGQLRLKWNPPQGSFDQFRLVRNAFGNPVNADDGVLLVDVPRADAPQTYLDDQLQDGALYYYSLFVRAQIGLGYEWRRVADTFGLVTKDHGYGDLLLERLPGVFTNRRREVGGQADRDTLLAAFLGLVGFELDTIRTTLESLLLSKDPDRVPGPLLPQLAAQLGQVYEPELGQAQNRVLLRNTVYLNKMKGTSTAATGLASSLTGWPAELVEGINLLLEHDDSSAELSTGEWSVTAGTATLTRRENDVAGPAGYNGTSVLGYRTLLDDVPHAGMFQVSATAVGPVELRLPAGGTPSLGVPVKGSTPYTLSAFLRDRGTHRTCDLGLAWYDQVGTLLTTTAAGSATPSATDDWSARAVLTATSPATARFVQPILSWPLLDAGEVQLIDGIQLEQGSSASRFYPARQIAVVLGPDRENLVTNPGFQANTSGWTNTGTGAISRVTDNAHSGGAALQVTAGSGGTPVGAASTVVTAAPGVTYTGSVWVYGPAGAYALSLHGTSSAAVTSEAVPASTWHRLSVVYTAAAGESSLTLSVAGPAGGTFRVDDALVERGMGVRPYFDGDSIDGETGWTGTAGASTSVFYKQRVIRDNRLRKLLPRYLPVGTSFELRYADGGSGFTVSQSGLHPAGDLYPSESLYLDSGGSFSAPTT